MLNNLMKKINFKKFFTEIHRFTPEVNVDIDFKFWAIIPAININFHSFSLEIEWLCLAIYVDKK